MKSPNLAKSLHTITVLVNLGLHLRGTRRTQNLGEEPKEEARACVAEALHALQLQDKPDVYGLAEIAAAQIERQIAAKA